MTQDVQDFPYGLKPRGEHSEKTLLHGRRRKIYKTLLGGRGGANPTFWPSFDHFCLHSDKEIFI